MVGTLYITEYRDWPLTGAPLVEQAVEFSAEPSSCQPLHHMTKGVRISADAPCGLSFTSEPARPDRHRVPANTDRDYQIDGTIKRIWVVASGRGGDVSEIGTLTAYAEALRASAKVTDPAWLDGRIAELAAATEAHNQAKAEAEAQIVAAKQAREAAEIAHREAEDAHASAGPREQQIAADAAMVAEQAAALEAAKAAFAADKDAHEGAKNSLEVDRAALDSEIEERIAPMRALCDARMRELDSASQKLGERAAAVEAGEQALAKAQAEHAAVMADLQKLSQRLGGVAT